MTQAERDEIYQKALEAAVAEYHELQVELAKIEQRRAEIRFAVEKLCRQHGLNITEVLPHKNMRHRLK